MNRASAPAEEGTPGPDGAAAAQAASRAAASASPRIPATALLLAGGRSRRMGKDKARLPLGSSTFLDHAVASLREVFEEVILAPGRLRLASPSGVKVVPDAVPEAGPIAALLAGLRASRHPFVYLWACDMPCFRPAVARGLFERAEAYDVVTPRTSDGVERFGAFYARAARPAIEASVRGGRFGLTSFWPRLRVLVLGEEAWRPLDPEGAFARNVNTPEDYERICREFGF